MDRKIILLWVVFFIVASVTLLVFDKELRANQQHNAAELWLTVDEFLLYYK